MSGYVVDPDDVGLFPRMVYARKDRRTLRARLLKYLAHTGVPFGHEAIADELIEIMDGAYIDDPLERHIEQLEAVR